MSLDEHEQQLKPGADPDVTGPIRDFNAANQSHQELWAETHQVGDEVRRASEELRLAKKEASDKRAAHQAIQAVYPRRSAPLARQVALAAGTVAADAVACWFAAQALGDGQMETLLWTGLFLAILAAGEVALDRYSDRSPKTWRVLAAGLAAFIAGLGVLRFLFLDTVGAVGAVAALVGAALFTVVTAGFVMIGYRALRAAETFRAAQARIAARKADRGAKAAAVRLASRTADRDRLVDAYLSRIRVCLLERFPSSELPRMVAAIRAHLTGGDGS
jgi:hypothetical protein